MDSMEAGMIRQYLANLRVEVSMSGHNRVAQDWRDLDYLPDYNKFYYILEGEGWLKIGPQEFQPRPGQWFLMPQGVRQSYSFTSPRIFTKHWCHFTAKLGDANLFDLIRTPLWIAVDDPAEAGARFDSLHTGRSSSSLSAPLDVQSAMLRLISYYLSRIPQEQLGLTKRGNQEKLPAVLGYIQTRFPQGEIHIKELAQAANLSTHYFIRLFKRRMGVSPIRYINQKRVEEAKRLLANTDLPLKEIINRVGLNDVYYLSRLFKEHTGFSPTVYRKLFASL
jgi:AraC-like DNA-binding protein